MVDMQPLRGSWLRLMPYPAFPSAGRLRLPTEGEGWVIRPCKPFGLLAPLPTRVLWEKDLCGGSFLVMVNGKLGECLSIGWEIGSFVY